MAQLSTKVSPEKSSSSETGPSQSAQIGFVCSVVFNIRMLVSQPVSVTHHKQPHHEFASHFAAIQKTPLLSRNCPRRHQACHRPTYYHPAASQTAKFLHTPPRAQQMASGDARAACSNMTQQHLLPAWPTHAPNASRWQVVMHKQRAPASQTTQPVTS